MSTSKTKRVVRLKYAAFGLIVLSCAYILLWQPKQVFYWREFRTGNAAISKVEAFKQEHGHLPNTLQEVGVNDADASLICYRKENADEYVVWFGTSLGESMVYKSRTREWK